MKSKKKEIADICLIVEGSYPYVTGGVASWVQRLIKTFEHEFTFSVVALTAGDKTDEDMKYQLPSNVISFKSFNIFDYEFIRNARPVKLKKKKKQKINAVIKELMLKGFRTGRLTQDQKTLLVDILNTYKEGLLKDFLISHDGFKVLTEIYEERHREDGFLKYFYNWRNIHFVIWRIFMLLTELPKARIYHSPSTGFAGFLVCLMTELYNIPSIITEHGIYVQEREMELTSVSWLDEYYLIQMWLDFFKSLIYWEYQTVSSLITLYYGNKALQIEYGAPEEKIKVIPNGINMERFVPCRKERLTSWPPKIGIVARIDPVKDIKTFIEAVSIIKEKIPDIQAYIIGPAEDKEYHNDCLKLVNMLGLQKNITFTGSVDVTKYYKELDLVLLTSVKEAMPLAIMEAMASGIPVVATKVGACEELVFGLNDGLGQAGFVATVMDAEDIAANSLKILTNKEFANSLAQVGIKRIESFYYEDILQQSYRKEYISLMELNKVVKKNTNKDGNAI